MNDYKPHVGIDMAAGPDFTRLVLYCKCGIVEEYPDSLSAYDAGWRVYGNKAETKDEVTIAICPQCMAKREQKWRRRAVALYGAEAVDRADRIMREKHR